MQELYYGDVKMEQKLYPKEEDLARYSYTVYFTKKCITLEISYNIISQESYTLFSYVLYLTLPVGTSCCPAQPGLICQSVSQYVGMYTPASRYSAENGTGPTILVNYSLNPREL
jgi:hypothetical protein